MANPRLCSIPECGKPVKARGWCSGHYQRWSNHGDPLAGAKSPGAFRGCSVAGCEKPHRTLGYCTAHSKRFLRHGDPLGGGTSPGEALAWLQSHVGHQDDECLIWPYAKTADGWPVVSHAGRMGSASRLMCLHAQGEPPDPSYDTAHNCGNGRLGCINPRHLRWATRAENMADILIHGTDQRGEKHWRTRLSEDDVRQIRSLKGTLTAREIGLRFNVSRTCVSLIQSGRNWGWLE